MSDLKAIVGQIMQNPESVKSLVTLVKDPKVVARAAGISEQQWNTLSGFGTAVSGLLSRKTPAASRVTRSEESSLLPCKNANPTGKKQTALVGVLSLVAVTGTIAVLGTVPATALSSGARKPQA